MKPLWKNLIECALHELKTEQSPFIYMTVQQMISEGLISAEMAKYHLSRTSLNADYMQKDNSIWKNDKNILVRVTGKPFTSIDLRKWLHYSREKHKSFGRDVYRTYGQINHWLKSLNVPHNFIRKERLEGKSRKKGEPTVQYYYTDALSFAFFRIVLKDTCQWYNHVEGYKLMLKRVGRDMMKWEFAKYFNQTAFIKFILTRHDNPHLPTRQELIYYMRDFIAEALLQQWTEEEKRI